MLRKNYDIGKKNNNFHTIVAFIPARSGSKSIKDKNIRLLKGKPLLAWSIESCIKSKFIKDIIVSTDSKKYEKIAKKYGATSVILRPKKISGDKSTDLEIINHFLKQYKDFKYIAHVRPTTPIRDIKIFDKAINFFIKNNYSSLRTVHEMAESAYKTFEITKNSLLKSVGKKKLDYHSVPRQLIKKTYAANGVLDIYRSEHILKKKNLFGKRPYAFKTKFAHEIDSLEQFKVLKNMIG